MQAMSRKVGDRHEGVLRGFAFLREYSTQSQRPQVMPHLITRSRATRPKEFADSSIFQSSPPAQVSAILQDCQNGIMNGFECMPLQPPILGTTPNHRNGTLHPIVATS